MWTHHQPELFNIEQLAERTGVPRRTIYFYIKEGLLPRPTGRGRNSRYGALHVLRLNFIERTKDSMRLEAIRDMVRDLSEAELRRRLDQFAPRQNETLFTETTRRYRGQAAAVPPFEGDASPEEQELLRRVYEAQEASHDPLRPTGAIDRSAARHRWDAPRESGTAPRVNRASPPLGGLTPLRRWTERRTKADAIEVPEAGNGSRPSEPPRDSSPREVDWQSIRQAIERRGATTTNAPRDATGANAPRPTAPEDHGPRAVSSQSKKPPVEPDSGGHHSRDARMLREEASSAPSPPEEEFSAAATSARPDTWHRVRISEDVEIHYRPSKDPAFEREIQQLIRLARGLTGR